MTQPNLSANCADLWAAVAAQDDAAAELAVAQLTAADEPLLIARLAGATGDVAWWILRALAQWGGAASVDPILAYLDADDAALRLVAIKALGQLAERTPTTMQPHLAQLADHLREPDGFARRVAADALVQAGNAAIPPLVALLRESRDQSVRTHAAYALGKLATPEAAPALYRCLNDANYLVHTYAYEALEQMGLLENTLLQL